MLALVATGTRLFITFDWRAAQGERQRAIWRDFGGLVVAGFITILCFRLFNPYAFCRPGFLSVDLQKLLARDHTLGIFNDEWLDDVSQAQYLVSGLAESPPNLQWVNRTGYVFPLTNMIVWGMGAPIGVLAWLGVIVASVMIVRGIRDASRNLLLVVWLIRLFCVDRQFMGDVRALLPPALPGTGIVGGMVTLDDDKSLPFVRHGVAEGSMGSSLGGSDFWASVGTHVHQYLSQPVDARSSQSLGVGSLTR
ncbi:MAG UNVERIFIED_CONTAM: hypothetical protein LVT10_14515 [Anaerolineae bacterium]